MISSNQSSFGSASVPTFGTYASLSAASNLNKYQNMRNVQPVMKIESRGPAAQSIKMEAASFGFQSNMINSLKSN